MKYAIMCGGKYTDVSGPVPRQLIKINGERLVDRTIRLLRQNGVKKEDINITISDIKVLPLYQTCGVNVILNDTTYTYNVHNGKSSGYWCDGFYDFGEPTAYLFGDVYFSDDCVRKIVRTPTDDILFFGAAKPFALNYVKPYVEPFAFKVVNRTKFYEATRQFMKLQDEDQFWRSPIAWDLWAVIKGVPVDYDYFKKQTPDIFGDNYVAIHDYTCDVDSDKDVALIEHALEQERTMYHGKLKKVFGIVSYLPDDEEGRKLRIQRLERLFDQLGTLWPEVPIMIVTQNWKRYSPKTVNRMVRIDFDKGLGILEARQVLRREFLKINFDYLIMFDDDAIIHCDDEKAPMRYMRALDSHPNGFCFMKGGNNGHCPYVESQLNLCAISRYIYEREPIPDVDPQRSETFEDVVFSTLLHYKYPQNEFDIPQGIKCVHFKNPNINEIGGEVPSTWARAARYDWKALYKNKNELVNYIYEHKELPDLDQWLKRDRVDLVVPYVDSSDPNWQRLFNMYSPKKYLPAVDGENRFRGNDELFKYFFRGIEANFPWIGKIHLLVQNESQVPDWIDQRHVHVVCHRDFIPTEFLPTFNSCTIEMFLWNIPGLSEKFLYANDDFFALRPTQVYDWFGPDGKVKFSCRYDYKVRPNELYYNQMMSNVQVINPDMKDVAFRIYHIFRPYHKSRVRDCFFKYENKIKANITRFREKKNNNCYIFNYYDYINGYQENCKLTHEYCSLSHPDECIQIIDSKCFDTIVINDDLITVPENIYRAVLSSLARDYYRLSKYEKGSDYQEPIIEQPQETIKIEQRSREQIYADKCRILLNIFKPKRHR